MTHGVLKITSITGGEAWTVTLHTFHTGQHIPKVVRSAISLLANYYHRTLDRKPKRTRKQLASTLDSINATERLEYATSTAALIIAAQPCFLEPTTPESIKSLPKWSGMDSPYTLLIDGTTWSCRDQDGTELFKIDAAEELIDSMEKVDL